MCGRLPFLRSAIAIPLWHQLLHFPSIPLDPIYWHQLWKIAFPWQVQKDSTSDTNCERLPHLPLAILKSPFWHQLWKIAFSIINHRDPTLWHTAVAFYLSCHVLLDPTYWYQLWKITFRWHAHRDPTSRDQPWRNSGADLDQQGEHPRTYPSLQ